MMKTKTPHQNKFIKIIAMPIKALAKARDLYVRSMNNYANKVFYGPPGGSGWTGVSYADSFPRSFSTTSTRSNESEDFKELVRAASTSTLGNRVDVQSVLSSTRKASSSTSTSTRTSSLLQKGNMSSGFKGVPRSVSVGMTKIEEDKPTEFGETDYKGETSVKKKIRLFPRSKSSYASSGGTSKRNSTVS